MGVKCKMLNKSDNLTKYLGTPQNNRVSSLNDFLNLKGKTIWLITVPQFDGITEMYANSFITEWHVDDCYNVYGNKILIDDEINNEFSIYSPHATKFKENNNEIYRYLISLQDYNIINSETNTNHAAFYDKESADTYRIWLLMNFPRSEICSLLDDRITQCKLVNWNNFLKFGLEFNAVVI